MVAWSDEQREALAGIEATRAGERLRRTRGRVDLEELYAPRAEPRARARRARSRSRARGSSARSPPRWPSRPRRSRRRLRAGPERARSAAVRPSGGGPRARDGEGRRYGPRTWSTRPVCAATRSTRCSATPSSRVTPRRGELIVFDKLARGLVNHVLLPVPTEKTKGVLVSPTVYGNVLLGPTADDVDDKTRPLDHRGRARVPDGGRGARILPALDGARGDRDLRRAAGRDRAPRLPAQRPRRTSATSARAGSARPGSRARWRSPSGSREALAGAGLDLAAKPAADRPADAEHRRVRLAPLPGRAS